MANPLLAFRDEAGAKAWLAGQRQTQPRLMQAALLEQIGALQAERLDPTLTLSLLNFLHAFVVPAQASLEVRYARKALPLPDEDRQIFEDSQALWTTLGIAYLAIAPHFAPRDKIQPLLRAANAFRLAQYSHFQAGRACPPQLDQYLFTVLQQASASGIVRQPLTDPEFPHLGETNIGGLIAWAFLLRLLDPYHLTTGQFSVANRAISRWRELATFLAAADDSPRARGVSISGLLNSPLPEGAPHWLNTRPIAKKIAQRLEALRAGESPESLRLGRELSGTACIRLLTDIDRHLVSRPVGLQVENGPIELVFGAENIYALLRDERLNPDTGMDVKSNSISNQRMAVFGFDQVSRMPTAVRRFYVTGESWHMLDGKAVRPGHAGPRHLAPSLVADTCAGAPRLGVLRSLQADTDGTLSAELDWFGGEAVAFFLPISDHNQSRLPVFLLHEGEERSLIAPATAIIRPAIGLILEGASKVHIVPGEVLERGIDFVRYACQAKKS